MTAASGSEGSRPLRLLVVGPTNSPHVEDFAREIDRRGAEVFVGGSAWGGELPESKLPEAGIPVFPETRPSTLWIRRLMRELRPDVVHAHWLPYGVMARLGGARPLVATAWGSDVYLATWQRRAGYMWLLRRAEALLADSFDLLAQLRRLGAPVGRSSRCSWGVDFSTFSPPSLPQTELRRKLGMGTGPIMLSVRGFKDIYNPGVVIGAFERLADRVPDLQLVLKHNSSETPALPALRYPDRVRIVGPRPVEELADWFRAASVCVSLASSDSSPRSVWEAMACGCPCVVSDLPWARQELLAERQVLLAPIDAEQVASIVERVLGDPELARDLSIEGRAHVEANHDRDKEMEKMIGLYRELSRPRRAFA
ncbi:MAG: glycosyltransferase [Solirubrobacteraceae bacterium]